MVAAADFGFFFIEPYNNLNFWNLDKDSCPPLNVQRTSTS